MMWLSKASGNTTVEYGIILLIVVGASITALNLMGHSMSTNLDRFSAATGNLRSLESASAAGGGFSSQRIGSAAGYGLETGYSGNGQAGGCGNQCNSREAAPSLTPVETSGNGTNVTSAEGTAMTQTKAVQMVLTSQRDLQALAEQTQNPVLIGLAQKALMSAANQAAYVVITNPSNPANVELQGLKEIATQKYTDQQLSANPERILSSIEQWSRQMENDKIAIQASTTLSSAEKAEATNALNEIVASVNSTYGEERLDQAAAIAKPLRDQSFINSPKTFTALQTEAKSVLASGAANDNQALNSSLSNGVNFSHLDSGSGRGSRREH